MRVEVKPVVCDYGVYEDGELKLILNSSRNAELIKAIIEQDNLCNKRAGYVFNQADFDQYIINATHKEIPDYQQLKLYADAKQIDGCVYCDAIYDESDIAFALETGTCQYCHEKLEAIRIKY